MTEHNREKRLRVLYDDDGWLEAEESMEFSGSAETEIQSKWLDIFCPQDCCEITSATQLP